jgi:uncharacterized membrane protein
MGPYVLDWLNLLFRWFHFAAGVSWIGTSFYFVWLDDNLTAAANADDAHNGVSGELWSVHGGGFYHNQKYPVGPKNAPLTQHLHWFKWEAYTTWLSGVAMLAIVYYANSASFLIDRSVLALTPAQAILISLATLAAGWIVYDLLCRTLSKKPLALGIIMYLLLVFAAWGLQHVFSGRAAYIHVGAIIGTIMAANVFFIIIPGQRKMLAQIRAGKVPDPEPGRMGKVRSVHNTYLTLPVLFTMISNHFPMTYGNGYGWIVLALLGLAGVLVRYFFILSHKARVVPALPVAAALVIAAAAFAVVPRIPAAGANAKPVAFAQVAPVFAQRCAVCHSAHPTQPGFAVAPAGVFLDTPQHIAANASRIYAQAVASNAMPLGNITGMTQSERALVGAWIAGGARLK